LSSEYGQLLGAATEDDTQIDTYIETDTYVETDNEEDDL